MPILDINGNAISSSLDFPNNGNILNLEIGAGINYFGKKYFPLCYLLDIEMPNYPHFDQVEDYEGNNVHYLDYVCNFYEIETDRTFDRIIFCNPYEFGLHSEVSAKKFLDKIGDLLNVGGVAVIIGNHTNRFAKYRNADRFLKRLNENNDLKYGFELSDLTEIADTHEYRVNQVFRKMLTDEPTIVNEYYNFTKTS